jgi:hypothetical protein
MDIPFQELRDIDGYAQHVRCGKRIAPVGPAGSFELDRAEGRPSPVFERDLAGQGAARLRYGEIEQSLPGRPDEQGQDDDDGDSRDRGYRDGQRLECLSR